MHLVTDFKETEMVYLRVSKVSYVSTEETARHLIYLSVKARRKGLSQRQWLADDESCVCMINEPGT